MKPRGIRVQTKLFYSLVLLIAVFLAVFVFSRGIEKKALALLFRNNAMEKERTFDKLLKLRGAPLEAIAFDYTYWDEILLAVNNDDIKWANTYISPSVLANYNINSVWIYNAGRQLYYSLNNLKDGRLPGIVFPAQLFDLLFQRHFAHFFFNSPAGLMEMRAATIHPGNDPERKTVPQGYFFAGRLWSESYIKELASLTDSAIQLKPWPEGEKEGRIDLRKGVIVFPRVLSSWDGKPVKQLAVSFASKEIKEFNTASKTYFFILLVFSGGMVALGVLILIAWVFLPLHSISAALKNTDLKYLQKLENEKNEFGDIARLIVESFRQREEIQRLYAMTRSILEKSPFGVYVANEQGGIDYVNPAMLAISGDSEEQFKGLCIFELPGYRESGLADKIRAVFGGRPFYVKSVRYTSQFSRKTTVRNMSGMLFEEEGRKKALVFVEDVTERENLEQMKTSLIHMIVHDLNNPLAGISGNAQLLQMELQNSLTEEQRNSFYWIMYGVQEMQTMVSNMLDVNKMEEGKFNLRYEKVDVNALLKEIANGMKVVVGQEKKAIAIDAAPDVAVQADREILKRIISNLVGNALKFTPAGSTITIEAHYDVNNKRFLFGVRDQGIGIPKEYLPRIFDKFVQVEAAQTRRKSGKGLGLTFCRMAVEAHGGKIWAESEAGKGTVFYFTLPG